MNIPVWKPIYLLSKLLGMSVEWEVSVGAAIFRMENGRRLYLVLRYPSGHYDFPKGHVEAGESEEDTLRRETEEETGITELSVFPVRESIRYFYVAKGGERSRRRREGRGLRIFKQVHFYPAETHEKHVRISHEHTGFEWLPYEEAYAKLTFENAKRVLASAESFVSNGKRKKDGTRNRKQ